MGAYRSGNANSPVALCTLSSHDLLSALAALPEAEGVNIIGPLETENVGIERMITTLLDRPRIRWLVVCGDEQRGRYQAQAIRSLFSNGVDSDGRILEAQSRRARLPTLRTTHVEALRAQVTLRDLAGEHDPGAIYAAVAECLAHDLGPFEARVALPSMPPIEAPTRRFRLREHDPMGFFVVLVDRDGKQIVVEHYTPDGAVAHRIAGADAESLCVALEEWGLISRLDHASYMGRELTKAEFALRNDLQYRQDESL
ncbi:MAG: Tetrahydromethanopterin S-methyltransferase, subunit [Chloroflexi bacterium]|nr:Tetrahydromethanopterin S-methyltransferase, subunit [Chloroflexota bacterium]